ncbi:MAG: disulfide bond formation protein B [Gammaproteobacteria bacterium]|nr:disulfide bond formation protein B [Gammaproteobacteria bacterium]|tara:strand:+ start:3832 stop:4338 length:507 start_codon:yes stop_codon:yes gene_type:complete
MFKKNLNLIKNIYQLYFDIAIAISAMTIILLAVIMDKFLYLQACPLCILTRYIFGMVAISAIIGVLFKTKIIGKLLVIISSIIGILVTTRQIYIQNMSIEDIAELSGCGMPFNTQIEYFGLLEAIRKTLSGGPSCAEDGWRFILNFAEWGFLFFLTFLIITIVKIKNK